VSGRPPGVPSGIEGGSGGGPTGAVAGPDPRTESRPEPEPEPEPALEPEPEPTAEGTGDAGRARRRSGRRDDAIDRLIGRTRRRLTLTTLGLLALLVAATGLATAFVGLRVLDDAVNQALDASATAVVDRLAGELPAASGQLPAEGEESPVEEAHGSSDTFVLVLDPTGAVVIDSTRVPPVGLPNRTAVVEAAKTGRDLRDIQADGVPIRLETLPVRSDGTVTGYVQAGFYLTLHDQQARSLVLTVALVALLGLAAAGLIARLVTGRALVPVRDTMAAQRRFVADASHELRTPATIIRAGAEILEREDLVAPDGRPLVQDIEAETDRLGRLVDDLLTLASTDAGVLRVERERLDLVEVATDTVRRAGSLAEERRVRLAVEAVGPAWIDGDRDRLVQLLLILVDNASAHSPDDGLVTVSVAAGRREVVLAVSDEGPGVPVAERERVFEPFHRLPDDRRTEGGTGLGLAIGRRLADAHGARISVGDAPGGGARFEVTFPAA
jgi:two-component system sensor histidine kinase CiaH